jgi:hypothetical protein
MAREEGETLSAEALAVVLVVGSGAVLEEGSEVTLVEE